MEESLTLFEEIMNCYVKNERKKLKLEPSKPELMIFDVFSGQA